MGKPRIYGTNKPIPKSDKKMNRPFGKKGKVKQ